MASSFTKNIKSPLLICVLEGIEHPSDCITTIRNAIYDGADGFALHLDWLDMKYHNITDLTRIFNYTADKPIYTMNYRRENRSSLSDEDLVEVQLMALQAGANMCDFMGDIYDPSPMQLSLKPSIIDKQKKLIDKIHTQGKEVLLSSHTWVFMTAEETVEHAKKLEARGADIVKIAMCANSEDEMLEVIKTTVLMKRELKVPFLHVCMGQYGKLHRVVAPMLGSSLALCVQKYTNTSHKEQPLLRSTNAVFDNLDWGIARNYMLGTKKED